MMKAKKEQSEPNRLFVLMIDAIMWAMEWQAFDKGASLYSFIISNVV
jgi:hypothetical protein